MAVITAEECRRFKVLRILETAGQEVLTFTLLCGMPGKDPADTLIEYLSKLPKDSKSNYSKEQNKPTKSKSSKEKKKPTFFNETDLGQIKDTSCTTFDITLLYKAIQLACEDVAGINETVDLAGKSVNKWSSYTPDCELEYFTNQIKKERNAVVHEGQPLTEKEFLDKVAELTGFFDSCLLATKDRYGVDNGDYQKKKDAVKAKVAAIRDENVGEDEILRWSGKHLLPFFKQEMDKELRAKMDRMTYLTPLHFLSGLKPQRVEVGEIFCDIELEDPEKDRDNKYVDYLKMLQLCNAAGSPAVVWPKVLLVEGEAGSGKSTLATFLLAEWLAPQQDRRVQGLDSYDLLMWVVCRDETSKTLQDFVKKLVPESDTRYGRLLLPLLRRCHVLMIIDGLDERNDESFKLVADILSEAAAATSFTIVCTSRPESVQRMKKSVARRNFEVSHVRLRGISRMKRTELVVKHYKCLSGGTITAADTDNLRQLVEDISSKDMFRVPLNLLFLATLVYNKRNEVKTILTQADLYHSIHTWSVEKLEEKLDEKLEEKLETHVSVLRPDAVETVLGIVYKVALKGLLRGRVYLSSQDEKDVRNACTEKDLNCNGVLSAFFSMRREESSHGVEERYQAPHKGLQEYLAAKYIAKRVTEDRQEAIKRVLETHTEGGNPPFKQLTNMLEHLLAVLTRQGNTVTAAMKEAVDLLRQNEDPGQFGRNIINDRWLELLVETAARDALMQYVAGGLSTWETIRVTSNTIRVASVVLQHLPPQCNVEIRLLREVDGVNDLVDILPRHHVWRFQMVHHFRHPHKHASGPLLHRVPSWSHLRRFTGHLEQCHLKLLPSDLEYLLLAVRDNSHAQTLLPALASLPSSSMLRYIGLHIPVADITREALRPLPQYSTNQPAIQLFLSGITDQLVEAARDIVVALTPPEARWLRLVFPGATLDLSGWQKLFVKLNQAGVRMRMIGVVDVPKTCVTANEARQLSTLTHQGLGCGLMRRDDEEIWDFYED